MRLQQGTYVVSSAPVQSGISTVCPDMNHVPSNTGIQQQYSTAHVQHIPPGMLWGTHIITQGNLTQGNNTYSVPHHIYRFNKNRTCWAKCTMSYNK
jgi:hypothetical protein